MKAKKELSKRQIEKTYGNAGDKDESVVVYCSNCHAELLDPKEKRNGSCAKCTQLEKEYCDWLDSLWYDD